MAWPWVLLASGGKKLRQTEPALRATRTANPTITTAATSQPTIAPEDGLLPGVVDIDCPRTRATAPGPAGWVSPGGDRSRPSGRVRPSVGSAPIITERAARACRAGA